LQQGLVCFNQSILSFPVLLTSLIGTNPLQRNRLRRAPATIGLASIQRNCACWTSSCPI